ncbi:MULTISPECIES: DUF6257 family protein [Streptomyces]|uniref:Uncharacterized protein n=1 Tax=Streptomyces venezuelae (strain ATCC 10712 / CBS 650.69 / DSM 40230 / JCM 4526 / NBRC 13096 / PD 04745) TaxID=953739 RepID=F2RJJ6_STRVP|nr:DUF6257 family protein [Streptomyces venezuelae]APE21215.1 hypothetical protein vnz_09395 [Streptomyces venezuelae]QER98605.1 hypothetical protein DEJ43_09500 [Streptomyces venezuelae ATCC 10712]CCA55206.1 hypothetical protein SVEN_1919 [Streptomyces venezuelae ATCC 10712]
MAGKKNEYDPKHPPLTTGEKAKFAWYVGRMAKRGLAGESVYQGDLEAKVDRILDGARERAEKDAKRK